MKNLFIVTSILCLAVLLTAGIFSCGQGNAQNGEEDYGYTAEENLPDTKENYNSENASNADSENNGNDGFGSEVNM